MREINVELIRKAVRDLCISANKKLPQTLVDCIGCAYKEEQEGLPKEIMGDIIANLSAAEEIDVPICQDTGMAVVFIEVGQDVHLVGGSLNEAINNGVHDGYIEGYLRCSVVKDPIRRGNTGDNTPAVIHTTIVEGDKVKITVAPKGFGSENMSTCRMFTPTTPKDKIIDYIVEAVETAGSNPCPPMVVGIGIGGDFEYSAILSKKALCRDVSVRNQDEFYADMEAELLERINNTNIGPQGFGGKTTALCVNIETYPTHIAGLPVAINIGCHVTRHAETII